MSGDKSIGSAGPELERARNGRSSLALLLALALVALGALAWWFARAGDTRAEVSPPPAPSAEAPATTPDSAAPMTTEPLEIGRSEKLPRPVPQPFDEKRLDGRGHIRGVVQPPAGVEFPQEWVLSVLPSTSLIGKDRAETRRLEFHAGEREFDLPDLALGGYMLRATAFGLASDEQHMLLAKPAETELYVVMQLAVTSFVEGAVRFEDYAPAAGLELALEPRPSGPRIPATTDVSGHFLFTDVKSGGYTLHVGRAETPVREPLEVNVGSGPERLADIVVPKLGELIVRVVDTRNTPVPGVKLEGYGENGGRLEGVTNADGEFRAKFLPPGRITVNAVFPDGARLKGRQTVDTLGPALLQLVREP